MLALICIGQAGGGGGEETESIKRGSIRCPDGSGSKESACNAEDLGSIPGSGRPPGERNGCPLQYSCLENSVDRGAWWAIVRGAAKSWTELSN